jgi:hypothetical protein
VSRQWRVSRKPARGLFTSPAQESVAFIPREFQSQVSELLKDERQLRIQPLELKDRDALFAQQLFDALQLAILPAVDPGYRALAEIFQFDQGAQRVVLPAQESVAFIPREFQSQVSELLKDERQLRQLFDALQLAILPAVDPGYRALAEIFQFKRLDAHQ